MRHWEDIAVQATPKSILKVHHELRGKISNRSLGVDVTELDMTPEIQDAALILLNWKMSCVSNVDKAKSIEKLMQQIGTHGSTKN